MAKIMVKSVNGGGGKTQFVNIDGELLTVFYKRIRQRKPEAKVGNISVDSTNAGG